MYILKRYSLKSVIIWTKREIIFFILFSTIITVAFELLNIKWLQIPFAPVGLVGTAVAFLVGFQNNSAYDRIWEARKIWGGIVNTSRSLIITVKDSFYIHNISEAKPETKELRTITHRHVVWLTALRYALRTKKSWEAFYEYMHSKVSFKYNVPEQITTLEDEMTALLSKVEFDYVMAKDNKAGQYFSFLGSNNLYIFQYGFI